MTKIERIPGGEMNLKEEIIKILKKGISCGFGEDIISVDDAVGIK